MGLREKSKIIEKVVRKCNSLINKNGDTKYQNHYVKKRGEESMELINRISNEHNVNPLLIFKIINCKV